MNPIATFIQTGICWLLLILFVRNCVIPYIEFIMYKYEDEPENYQI
jgi:hypothetical protein